METKICFIYFFHLPHYLWNLIWFLEEKKDLVFLSVPRIVSSLSRIFLTNLEGGVSLISLVRCSLITDSIIVGMAICIFFSASSYHLPGPRNETDFSLSR